MIVEFHFPLFSQLGLSYALASGGAVGTALGINKLVSVSNHNVTIVSLDITLMITSASVKSNKCRKAHYVKHCMCIQIDQNIKYFSEKFRKYFVIYICFIFNYGGLSCYNGNRPVQIIFLVAEVSPDSCTVCSVCCSGGGQLHQHSLYEKQVILFKVYPFNI